MIRVSIPVTVNRSFPISIYTFSKETEVPCPKKGRKVIKEERQERGKTKEKKSGTKQQRKGIRKRRKMGGTERELLCHGKNRTSKNRIEVIQNLVFNTKTSV